MTSITLDSQRSQLEWFRLVREYQKSPLGKHAFCEAHKISRGDFRIWEQRLLEEESAIKASHPSCRISAPPLLRGACMITNNPCYVKLTSERGGNGEQETGRYGA